MALVGRNLQYGPRTGLVRGMYQQLREVSRAVWALIVVPNAKLPKKKNHQMFIWYTVNFRL